jgi:hypothetical protein
LFRQQLQREFIQENGFEWRGELHKNPKFATELNKEEVTRAMAER